jgi:hypothetical protein
MSRGGSHFETHGGGVQKVVDIHNDFHGWLFV